ncbi:DUF6090 family protein [Winogradskyella sp. A3E31]|uniref:DUF6090 family protein n=1 Tax=Winogradskyella sp. A3E31 TaxID=3349637 RepID=UPI00398AE2A4
MIKFFRHIRRNLMEQNKTSKYLKYAIGEIILVVIGILIALQINNWNEERKANSEEQNLFKNLKIDFESRLLEFKEMNSAREVATNSLLRLNKIIAQKDSLFIEAEIDSLLSTLINGFKFNEEFKMLDVVFNTGLINDIKNENLKRQLIDWPQKVEEMLEEQRMHNHLIDDQWIYHLSKYLSIRDIYEKFNFREYKIPTGEPVTLKKDYTGFLTDIRTENYLAQFQLLMRVNHIDTQTLIASAEDIIRLLDQEIL